jgi:hypothetical protein
VDRSAFPERTSTSREAIGGDVRHAEMTERAVLGLGSLKSMPTT